MPDSNDLFDLEDFVPAGGSLPEHLKGKSAEDVATYYSGLMRTAQEKVGAQPPAPPAQRPPAGQPPVENPTLTAADVAPALGTMIQSAKMVGRASLDADSQKLWDRFSSEIETIMKSGFKGIQLADAQNWIFAYNQVLGSKSTLLMKEAREAEQNRRTAESSAAAHETPPQEITLTAEQKSLAENLNIGEAGFKNGIDIMAKDKWPLTFSNQR